MLDRQVPAGPSCSIHCLAACHVFHPTAQAHTSLHQFEVCLSLYLYLCLIPLLGELILCSDVGLSDVIFSILFPPSYWVLFRDLPSRILNINQSYRSYFFPALSQRFFRQEHSSNNLPWFWGGNRRKCRKPFDRARGLTSWCNSKTHLNVAW